MMALDAAWRDVCSVKRETTATPLQAFVFMNDPQFVEASRSLAELAIKASAEFDTRLDFISTRLIARSFESDERAIVKATFDEALTSFKATPDAAKLMIATGETKPDPALDPVELAAWTLVTSQVLNLDETLTK